MKVTVDGQEVFMAAEDLPAFSFAVASDLNLTGIKGSKSTTFKIPATAAARNALGGSGMGEARRGDVELRIGKGGEDYHRSTTRVIEADAKEIRLAAVGGNASWTETFSTTRINELDLGETGEIGYDAQVSTWYTDTTPAIFPVADHGYLQDRAAGFSVAPKYIRPGVRLWYIMEKAFDRTGHTLRIKGALSRYWRKLFIYEPKERYTLAQSSIDRFAVVKETAAPYEMGDGNGGFLLQDVQTTVLISGTSGPGYYYAIPYAMKISVRLEITLTYRFATFTNGTRRLNVKLGTSTPGSPSIPPGTVIPLKNDNSVHTESFSVEIGAYDLAPSIDYEVRLLKPYDPNVSFFLDTMVVESARITWTPVSAPYDVGLSYSLDSAMPGLSCMEVLKSISAHKCLSITTDDRTKTVTIEEYDDFIRPISEGVDMRDRQDFDTDTMRIRPRRPRNVLFRPTNDEGDELLKEYTETFNRIYSQHDEHNEQGDQKDETVSSAFAPTINDETLEGLDIPIMRDAEGDYQVDSYDRTVRLLIHDHILEGEWVYFGSNFTEYPYCYYAKSSEPVSLAMGEETFYGGTGPGTSQTNWSNKLRRYFNSDTYQIRLRLYDDELLGFDFGVPRLLWHTDRESSWFLMQKIDQKRFGLDAPTRCQLQQL